MLTYYGLCLLVIATVTLPGTSTSNTKQRHFKSKKIQVTNKQVGDHKPHAALLELDGLQLDLVQDDGLYNSTVLSGIRQKFGLAGMVYTGRVVGMDDCEPALIISKDGLVLSGNIQCRRKHIIVQYHQPTTEHLMFTKYAAGPNTVTVENERKDDDEQKYCSLAIYTDPFLWNHVRQNEQSDEDTRFRMKVMILSHVLAANQFYRRYEFNITDNTEFNNTEPEESEAPSSVQFVLANFTILSPDQCEDPSTVPEYSVELDADLDYIPSYENEPALSVDTVETFYDEDYTVAAEYEDYDTDYVADPSFINDQDYGDWNQTRDDFAQLLDDLENPFGTSPEENVPDTDEQGEDLFYAGESEDYAVYPEEDTANVLPTYGNCYEEFDGAADPSTAFCSHLEIEDSMHLLNLFSTIDNSKYCLAQLWTFRDLDVVGLADSPTTGAPYLSGYCAQYDTDCGTGFNTGLISFRHLGNEMTLADSQAGL